MHRLTSLWWKILLSLAAGGTVAIALIWFTWSNAAIAQRYDLERVSERLGNALEAVRIYQTAEHALPDQWGTLVEWRNVHNRDLAVPHDGFGHEPIVEEKDQGFTITFLRHDGLPGGIGIDTDIQIDQEGRIEPELASIDCDSWAAFQVSRAANMVVVAQVIGGLVGSLVFGVLISTSKRQGRWLPRAIELGLLLGCLAFLAFFSYGLALVVGAQAVHKVH